MKIGIEARWITFERTGYGNYTLNLLKELAEIDNRNEYLIYLNKNYENDNIFSKPNFNKEIIPRSPAIYKHIFIPLDIIRKKREIDFFHFAYNAPSLLLPCPFVLTIHDLSHKYIPNMLLKKNLLSINAQYFLKVRKAIKIITVSECSKKDIINFYKVPDEKIEVIYEGIEESFRPIDDEQSKMKIRRKYELPDNYLLYVGTYLPHKNLETLLKAYHRLKQHKGIKHSLVLAGKKGRNYEAIKSLISILKLNADVKTIGFVPDEELPYIYNLSSLFIFPSLYEGFGLPLLEAMACGVPVLSSNSSCLPEIGGDSAIYFSPNDIEELVKKILMILTNDTSRCDLIERGMRRARLFSWRKMAEKTLQVYENCNH